MLTKTPLRLNSSSQNFRMEERPAPFITRNGHLHLMGCSFENIEDSKEKDAPPYRRSSTGGFPHAVDHSPPFTQRRRSSVQNFDPMNVVTPQLGHVFSDLTFRRGRSSLLMLSRVSPKQKVADFWTDAASMRQSYIEQIRSPVYTSRNTNSGGIHNLVVTLSDCKDDCEYY